MCRMRGLLHTGLIVVLFAGVGACEKKPGSAAAGSERRSSASMDETTEMEPPPEPIKKVGKRPVSPGVPSRKVKTLRQACRSGDRAACLALEKLGVKR